ncbi:MAG: ribosome biogenesis GTPase YlqF [Erysipelotrichaceae bacterium]
METNKQEEQQVKRVNINWFPGHMTKAKREMQEKLKMVDMVIELRDARIPNASKNPLIDTLIQNKPRLIVLTKIDKAEDNKTKAWVRHLSDETTMVITVNTLKDNVVNIVTAASKELMKPMIERQIRKGIRPRAIRAMVVGVPNVGKSTLINRIAKRKAAETANRPGVTRALQWVKINSDLELLDTPGVLWPKFEDYQVGMLLAISGAIRDEILPLEEISAYAMEYLAKYYPNNLQERYHIEVDLDPYVNFERIAHVRKFYTANKEIDHKRVIETFLREVRDDLCGRITWEMPEEKHED